MKLYSFAPATNAQRVLMFVAEKAIDLSVVEVNVREGVLFEPSYLAMNPFSVVPFLQLDDGTCIGESVAICRYLEELYPNAPLCGVTAKDRALVEMWNRRIEIDGFMPVVHALRNVSPGFKGRVVPGTRTDLPQSGVITERGKAQFRILVDRLDAQLRQHAFVAGETFTIADITGYFMVQTARRIDLDIPEYCFNVLRWYNAVASRASVPH